MEAYYVYMLRCRGGSLYTGMTNDVARRMGVFSFFLGYPQMLL